MPHKVAQQFDNVALDYDFMATLFHNTDTFLEYLSTNRETALDIGCGSGNLVNTLSQHYVQVIGIDISENLLTIALAKESSPNTTFICMDAEHMAFDAKFDFIVSQNTFHHIADVPTLLERLKLLLKPAGKLIITDVVSQNPTPPRWVYIVGAFQEFVPNLVKYGFSVALRVFRFRLSPHWLNHLANDVYLSPSAFRELYAANLPACAFLRENMVLWQKP